MSRIERLYGVIHGGPVELGGRRLGEIIVRPSLELLLELEALPSGTKVGVESFPEFHSSEVDQEVFRVNGRSFNVGESPRFFWEEIVKVCRDHNLEIVFLDDLPILRECASKLMEAVGHERILDRYLRRQNKTSKPISEDRVRELEEAIYKAKTEAEWTRVVRREERLVENILQYQPQVVILGMGHGDYLMLNQETLAARGLRIDSYKKEEAVSQPQYSLIDFLVTGRLPEVWSRLVDGYPDSAFVFARELLRRRHNAVTQWRILPELTSDFIGTWDMSCRSRGLFEIHTSSFGTFIEDSLGTAFLVGEINERRVRFAKIYDAGRRSEEAALGPILYEGEFRSGRWDGTWETEEEGGSKIKGGFCLYKGSQFIV